MMNYALVINGIVENTFICDNDESAVSIYPNDIVINVDGKSVGIGWIYDGDSFHSPDEQPIDHDEGYLSRRNDLAYRLKVDVERLNLAYLSAIVVDGSSEAGKVVKIRDELTARKQQYKDDIAALDYEYGV